jgi:hypothetical protein
LEVEVGKRREDRGRGDETEGNEAEVLEAEEERMGVDVRRGGEKGETDTEGEYGEKVEDARGSTSREARY